MRDTLNGTIKHNVDEHSTVGSTELNEPLCISHDPSLEHRTWDSLSLSTESECVLLFDSFLSNLTVLQYFRSIRSFHGFTFSPFAGTTSSSSERTCYWRRDDCYCQSQRPRTNVDFRTLRTTVHFSPPVTQTLHCIRCRLLQESENVLLFKTFVSNLTVLQNIQPGVRSSGSHQIPFSPFAGTTSSSSERTCYSREHNSYRQ